MPIYGYTCDACGYEFDRLQKLSDPDPDACPECGKKAVHRQVTAPYFRLAGDGWYETDFKKAGDKKHNLAGDRDRPTAAASKDGTSGSHGKKDGTGAATSKAAKKAEPKPSAATAKAD